MTAKRATVIGVGMVGGSVASALRKRGWHVTAHDIDAGRVVEAERRGVIDAAGIDATSAITFIATPVAAVVDAARSVLDRGSGIVTDVASVKGPVVSAIAHERFVGGHPMAGSERSGLDGVNADLFEGATWVLTPGVHTKPEAYLEVRNVVTALGADVVTLDPDEHDEMVATISHVPHLAAAALMLLAVERSHSHEATLRLAAGGFRDMTRIAAGHPHLWADIVLENRDAIVEGLGCLTTTLDEIREFLGGVDRAGLEKVLSQAAEARRDLPLRQGRPARLVSVAVAVPDRPGALGEVFGLFSELRVNIEDVEINHAVEGGRGTLLLTIDADAGERVRTALVQRDFRVSLEAL